MLSYSKRNINIHVGEVACQLNTTLTGGKHEEVCNEAGLADMLLCSTCTQ